MPVHRHVHDKRGSVYAVLAELDDWVQSRGSRAGEPEEKAEAEMLPAAPSGQGVLVKRKTRLWFVIASVLCVCLVAGWLVLRHRATATAAPRVKSLDAILSVSSMAFTALSEHLFKNGDSETVAVPNG